MQKTIRNERLKAAQAASAIFMDSQMDADKSYFDRHPQATSYTRKPYPNEVQQGLFLDGREAKKMEIFNIGRGLRFKKYLY